MLAELTQVVVPNAWLAVIVGFLIPLVLGVLYKVNLSETWKVVLGLVAAGVAAVLQQAITDNVDAVFDTETLRVYALTWGVQIATYLGIYRPLGANAKLGKGIIGPKS